MKRLAAILLSAGLLFAACGSDPELDYTDETEQNFLASCADTEVPEPLPLDASDEEMAERREAENLRELQNDICRCTILGFRSQVPYPRFAEFDAELRANLEQPLQPGSAQQLVQCIRQEGSL